MPDSSVVRGPTPYQYNCAKSIELISGAGSRFLDHWYKRLFVTGQLKKRWWKLSLVSESLSMILQKEQYGDTVWSKALIRLFRGRVLFLKRNRKFLTSLFRKDLFQRPRHFFNAGNSGVTVLVKSAK